MEKEQVRGLSARKDVCFISNRESQPEEDNGEEE